MKDKRKIILATQNKDKILEIKNIMKGFDLITLMDLNDNDDVIEDGNSFEENARIKADYYFKKYNIPVIADDTGLCVKSLNNEPGIFSARYSKSGKYEDNRQKLLENLYNVENRDAFFSCVVCYIDEKSCVHYFEGRLNGCIIKEEKGKNGFGYDSIFKVDGYNKTLSEISLDDKNKISHRFIAFSKLIEYLNKK